MYFNEKIKAVELRKEGSSYSEIKKIINVSKSTLSEWLKDIPLTEEHKKRLTRLQATAYLGAKKLQERSKFHHEEIRRKAKDELCILADNSFFVSGLMLYWAEGDKRSGRLQFSNSDPEMIKLMMSWFRKFCKVPEQKFRICLFLHTLHTREDSLEYWADITGLPLKQFNRPYIKPTIYSNRKNKLYNGTCVIKIHSRDLWSKILGWIEGIKEVFLNQRICYV
ncbi:MAG: hypothetical protein AB1481_06645 [Candidatus Omnitrophota bacterium]